MKIAQSRVEAGGGELHWREVEGVRRKSWRRGFQWYGLFYCRMKIAQVSGNVCCESQLK